MFKYDCATHENLFTETLKLAHEIFQKGVSSIWEVSLPSQLHSFFPKMVTKDEIDLQLRMRV